MRKLFFLICLLFALNAFSQESPRVFTAKCNITQVSSGVGYWTVSITQLNDPGGLYDATEIQEGDKVFFNDGGVEYSLNITLVVSAVNSSATVRVSTDGVTGILSVPTTSAAVSRGTPNYDFLSFVANTSNNNNQLHSEYTVYRIDSEIHNVSDRAIDTSFIANDSAFIVTPLDTIFTGIADIDARTPGAASTVDTINGYSVFGDDAFTVADIIANEKNSTVWADSSNIYTRAQITNQTTVTGQSGMYDWDCSLYPNLNITASGSLDIVPKNYKAGGTYIVTAKNDGTERIISISGAKLDKSIPQTANSSSTITLRGANAATGTALVGSVVVASDGPEMDFISEYRDSIHYSLFSTLAGCMQTTGTTRHRVTAYNTQIRDYLSPDKYAQNWTGSSDANSPTLVKNVDGNTYLQFDGTNDILNGTGGTVYTSLLATGIFTVSTAVKKTTDGVTYRFSSGMNSQNGYHLAFNTSNQVTFNAYVANVIKCTITSTTTVTVSDGLVYIDVVGDGTNAVLYITKNGVTTSASAAFTVTPAATGMDGISIGAGTGVNNHFAGYVGWNVLFNRNMSTAALKKLRSIPLNQPRFGSIEPIGPWRWYDMSDTTTMYEDDAKTLIAGSNNDNVQRVLNKVGGWQVADMDIQGTGSWTVKTGQANGKIGVQALNTAYGTLLNNTIPLQDFTALIVFKTVDTTTAGQSLWSSPNSASVTFQVENGLTGHSTFGRPEFQFMRSAPVTLYSSVMDRPLCRITHRTSWNIACFRRKGNMISMSVNGKEIVRSTIATPFTTLFEMVSYSGSSVAWRGLYEEVKVFTQWLPNQRLQYELNTLATKYAITLDGTEVTDDINNSAVTLKDGATETSTRNYVTKPATALSTDGQYFWHVYRVSDNHSVDVDTTQTLEISKVSLDGVVQAGYPKVIYRENPAGDNRDGYEAFPLVINKDGVGEDSVLIVYTLYGASPYIRRWLYLLPNGTFTATTNINHPGPNGNVYFITDNILIDGNTWYTLGYIDNGGAQTLSILKTTTPSVASSWTIHYEVGSSPLANDYEEAQWKVLPDRRVIIFFRNNIEPSGTQTNEGSIGRIVAGSLSTIPSTASVTYAVLGGIARPSFDVYPDGTIALVTRAFRDEEYAYLYISKDLGTTWSAPTNLNYMGTHERYQRFMYGDVMIISKDGLYKILAACAYDFAFGNGCRIFLHTILK